MARQVDDLNRMERGTVIAVGRAVGERLRAALAPETTPLPPRLQGLLDEMRRSESDTDPASR
ncbi:hypothetical protein JQ557_20975 [Bradyrhizobium sp. U87765 SZCCT0131]|uniref:hypothetical protein n=1 Tax=unclassified Bradyrhizobium TaxID=2631580 RepID=UPI001BAC4D08|nr:MULTISPECIES: hypothetical protein [unclassified Bradyrhizobium]MBR1220487.1 hypothetical protein [Bradyrhizobium sp. U87765 SZCCT0131]MBR1263058.1 hypothetical protein [Bradyrhizobium sp. U87765 SZCCT0134]MBR1307059.1 hypothetical protein [Bradyrhizobium sp. U87765 SZCCT0110]MBR1323053.1 hypothetical protein [Bradyrhizobium sp. U87765 SZCCT0109]MBR1346013.1 hypothetical protein [Bradyrhizobium sp. U87765 SZCCT0048]